ncbi:PACE efflux transporter [Leucobacter allii]|uniref:PACE efflux transporter n=1 Tax=Leucobacter allii TaxID=2932247 RepID=A0ABY4FNS7_9MICO|nr:PACE efflux transporter [Leucobacter allii]UOQ57906.1 PACE efflux transporter [Leucobacter allii]
MTAPGHTPGMSMPATRPVPAPEAPAAPRRPFAGRPVLRRVVFVIGYEALSVLCTVLVLGALLGHGGGESTLTAILLSTVATLWNYVWNTAYEAWERRFGAGGRGPLARAVHALGYEGGVLVFTIPLVALMLGVGLLEAVMIEGGLLVFFLVFTVVYTWAFDRLFGLPESAA